LVSYEIQVKSSVTQVNVMLVIKLYITLFKDNVTYNIINIIV